MPVYVVIFQYIWCIHKLDFKILDAQEVSGRILRVQFAKTFQKPSPCPVGVPLPGETLHKIYVLILAWKARSNHLRDLFTAKVNQVSIMVVFENSSSRSAGYGFVSFGTREEAEIALSTFDGQVPKHCSLYILLVNLKTVMIF